MNALQKIRSAGFNVALVGDSFQITPASLLTQSQRDFLKSHKAEIVSNLRAETMGLSACDRETLLNYLANIGEDDPAMIQDFLLGCSHDAEKLEWALRVADKTLKIQNHDYSGLSQCSGCDHLKGDTCQSHGWRTVITNWRLCDEFLTSAMKRAAQQGEKV